MNVKSLIIALLLLFDSLGVPAIFFVRIGCTDKTFLSVIMCIYIILTIFLNIWAIIIIKKKLTMQFLLFSGILCLSLSLLHFRLFYDVLYNVVGNFPFSFLYIAGFLYILIIFIWFAWLKHALNSGYYSGRRKKKHTNYFLITSSALFGVVGFRITAAIGNENTKHILAAFCFLVLSYTTVLVSHNLYKYFLIKKFSQES